MRYDELRAHVEAVLRKEFEHRFAEIGEQGPRDTYTPDRFDTARAILAEGADAYWKRMGEEGKREWLGKVARTAGISPDELEPDRAQTLKLLHFGMRAVVDALEGRTEAVHTFELLSPPDTAKAAPEASPGLSGPMPLDAPGETLGEVVDLYIREQVRVGAWVGGTQDKRKAMLGVLTELLDASTTMNAITKRDAQDVKSVLFDLPANKNKHPIARDLSLREAAKLKETHTLSPRTLNDYLATFHTFTSWAAKNGYAKEGLFAGMSVNAGRGASVPDQVRAAFSPEAIARMVTELTRADSKIVRKPSNKWASLLGIFTGARLSEICSLLVADVKQHDGLWCISINDIDPDGLSYPPKIGQ